jgi:predicted CXXCH cytochrome family protein
MSKPVQTKRLPLKSAYQKPSGSKKPSGAVKARRFPLWVPTAAAVVVVVLALVGFVGMMKLEETDTFCGSCHTQPETAYLERMSKAVSTAAAVDAASSHQSRRGAAASIHCIDCHAGAGLTGRAAAIFEGAGNAVKYVTRTMVQPGKLRGTLPDENCLKCHAEVIQSESLKGQNNHYHFFLARWRQAAPDAVAACVECHNGHNDSGDPTVQYLVVAQTEAVCTRCHTVLRGE